MSSSPESKLQAFRPTLNKNGWMLCEPDATMRDWISFSRSQTKPVLDVGATFGIATLAALESGCRVIATDLDVRHLDEIVRAAQVAGVNDRLTCIAGRFPDAPHLVERSIGSVLLSRVITFMDPQQVRTAFRSVASLVTSGGKVFGTADSPFLANFTGFRTEFERRLSAREEWPGWISDTEPYVSANKAVTAQSLHLFSPEVIARELAAADLIIEEVNYINRVEYPPQFQAGGNESVRFIARVP